MESRGPIPALLRGLRDRRRFSSVLTCGPPMPAHLAGAVLRRLLGLAWVADHPRPRPLGSAFAGRLESRLLRAADVATSSNPVALRDLHERALANAVQIDEAGRGLERVLNVASARLLPRDGPRVLVIGPTNSPHVEDFALALRGHGVEVFVGGLPWGGGLGPSRLAVEGIPVSSTTWPATLWVRRLLRELRPAVVHAHWLPNAVVARLGRARPLVATAWGSDVYLASRRRLATYRWLLRRADAVLADSSELLAELRRLGAPPARSWLFRWGVDPSVFSRSSRPREELRRALGIGPGPVVLSARGFKDIYNPRVVIAAFERLAERRPDVQLVLKHNSSEPPAMPAPRFPDRVHVVGPQPREALADWFRAASVCVSIASSDSSPRSVWEAMACGCPCVVSDLPWAHQELEPGRHALLTPIDADAVASALDRVLGDADLAASLAAAGHEHVEAHHDRDNETRRLIGIYSKLGGAA